MTDDNSETGTLGGRVWQRVAWMGLLTLAWMWGNVSLTAAAERQAQSSSAIDWLDQYGEAMKTAKLQNRMLLVYFAAEKPGRNQARFESEALADPDMIRRIADDYIAVRLPLDATISVGGETRPLLDHGAYEELRNGPGVAIVDTKHKGSEQYGYVVSLFPLSSGRYYRFDPRHLGVLLDLPPGTLTQRTMVFAVRIHPESPASTVGEPDPVLLEEAREHSRHQAQIGVQGHHQWEHRYQRIGSRLPGGLRAQEVVAESWPNQGLLDACVDCVASWRQSSGHWGAVRSRQPRFGYDIRRGRNGIWYATGLFGNRH